MKPILIRLEEERKMEERVQRKIATAAKQREKRLGNKG